MSKITIFAGSPPLVGDYSADSEAITVVECDDRYDEKFLNISGWLALNREIKLSKKCKYFVNVTEIISKHPLAGRIRLEYGVIDGAYIIKNVNSDIYYLDTLCLIFSEMNVDLSMVSDFLIRKILQLAEANVLGEAR